MDIHYTARLSQDKHSGNMANLTSEWFCYACIRDRVLFVPLVLHGTSSKRTTIHRYKKTAKFLKFLDKFKLLKQRILCL